MAIDKIPKSITSELIVGSMYFDKLFSDPKISLEKILESSNSYTTKVIISIVQLTDNKCGMLLPI